jgi:ankyrin repeat protein
MRPGLLTLANRPNGDVSPASSRSASQDFSDVEVLFASSEDGQALPQIGLQAGLTVDRFTHGQWFSQAIQAAEGGNVHTLANILERNGKKNVEQADDLGCNLLHHAAMEGQDNAVDYLLRQQKLHPAQVSHSGKTPLHYAACVDSPSAVASARLLLEAAAPRYRSAFVNLTDVFGQTSLMYAASAGNLDMVSLLLSNGAAPDAKNSFSSTALMSASARGARKIAKLLLSTGQVSIDHTNFNGTTALMMAAREGHLDMVNYLLRKGANPLLTDHSGQTALFLAEQTMPRAIGPLQANYKMIVKSLKNAMNDYAKKTQEVKTAPWPSQSALVFTKEPGPFGKERHN